MTQSSLFRGRLLGIVRLSIFGLACICSLGCGSGGGGGGGGSSGAGRTTDTGLRIIHASIDSVAVTLFQDGVLIQSAHYAETKGYSRLKPGPSTLTLEVANSPGTVIASIPATIENKTEYSLLFSGLSEDGSLTTTLLTDVVARPEAGSALVRAVNGYTRGLDFTFGTLTPPSVLKNEGSEFQTLPSGPQLFVIRTRGGEILSQGTITLPDRGEVTLVATGAPPLGVFFTPVFNDLD